MGIPRQPLVLYELKHGEVDGHAEGHPTEPMPGRNSPRADQSSIACDIKKPGANRESNQEVLLSM
jgi:hypothetical protein